MARRRLTLADAPAAPLETKSALPPRAPLAAPFAPPAAPPVARAAAEAAEASAEALRAARRLAEAEAEGRLLLDLPLDAVEAGHLARDRAPNAVPDEDEAALIASIRAHGQRSPAEVVRLGPGRYGLISGWRRLAALRTLHRETGEPRFGVIRALLRGEGADGRVDPSAYVAMVEENEIRVGLTPYERGRIAVIAAERGAFLTPEQAVDALFAAASRAKRSKIRSFAELHQALGKWLLHPAAIPERLGLKLAEALRGPAPGRLALFRTVEGGDPYRSAAQERRLLERALAAAESAGEDAVSPAKRGRPETGRERLAEGLWLVETAGRGGVAFRLEGPRAADPELLARARKLLRRLGRAAGQGGEGEE